MIHLWAAGPHAALLPSFPAPWPPAPSAASREPRLGALLAASLLILVPALLAAAALAERLANPGFEGAAGTRADGWAFFGEGYAIDRETRRSGASSIRAANATAAEVRGATATIDLDQEEPAPILVTGWSRAEDVSGFPNNDYSIYLDLIHQDGTPLWGQTAPFSAGTHDWQLKRVLVVPRKPIRRLHIHALFRHHTGTVWFDDFSAVELSGDGIFDGQPVAAPELPAGAAAGWLVRDVAAGSEPALLVAGDGGEGEDRKLGIRLRVVEVSRVSARGRVLRARIEDLAGKPRAVTLYRVERFEAEEPVWWNDIREAAPARTGERANLTRINVGATGSMSLYPFGCVAARGSDGTGDQGADRARHCGTERRAGPAKGRMVGLAPLQGPRVARIGFHARAKLLYVAVDLALTAEGAASSDGASHGRADVEVVASDVDPEWGFRAAARNYYDLFPEAFERRATAEGIWIPFTDPARVGGVEDFGIAYHEGDNSIASDDRLGILSFRYTEPMTWWMPMAKGVPRDYETALDLVRRHEAGPEGAARSHAQAVIDSGTHDEGGRVNVEFVDAPWTDGAVWVLNPNPRLPRDPDRWTKARLSYTQEMGDRMYGPGAKGVQDGEYLDSIEGWADVLDFRPESIRHSAAPPTFTTDGFRPVIPTWFSVWELAAFMREDLRGRGKLLMANATPWRVHAFAPLLDVLGTETNWLPGGTWRPDSDAVFNLRRTLCWKKPYLLLQNTDFDRFGPHEVERYFQRCMFYGVYPSMFSVDASTRPYWTEPKWYDRDRHLFKRYIPAIRKLSAAGWEPVTLARSDDPSLWVERFGSRHFTAFNPSGGRREAVVAVEAEKLGLGETPLEAADIVTGEVVGRPEPGAVLRIRISLGPEECLAVELR